MYASRKVSRATSRTLCLGLPRYRQVLTTSVAHLLALPLPLNVRTYSAVSHERSLPSGMILPG